MENWRPFWRRRGLAAPAPSPIFSLPLNLIPSEHYSSRFGAAVLAIVDHVAEGPYHAVVNYLKKNALQVSAHYVIGSEPGQIAQQVNDEYASHHAGIQSFPNTNPYPALGNPNRWTIGIEHGFYSGQPFTEGMYLNTLALHRELFRKHGKLLLLEHRNFDPINRARCPGTTFPRERLRRDLGVNVSYGVLTSGS